jgi:DNA repair protein RecN (Recombination protein N)
MNGKSMDPEVAAFVEQGLDVVPKVVASLATHLPRHVERAELIRAGALGLVLGAKGEAGLVGPHGDEVYIEADFRIDEAILADPAFAGVSELIDDVDDGLLVARRVGRDGRGRTLVGGRSATRGALEDAGGRMVGVVSQHESRRLSKPAAQRAILDAFGGEGQDRKLRTMAAAWRDLVAARAAREAADLEAAGLAGRLRWARSPTLP